MHRVLDLCIHQNANKQVKVLEEAPRNGEQGPFTPFKTPNLRKTEF
jgi:hypothetical protein